MTMTLDPVTPAPFILRDYQLDAIARARAEVRAGRKRILIHSGTGTGKTLIASEITKSCVAKGFHVVFLAHRKELINQAHAKLAAFGVPSGVLMGSDKRRAPWLATCVASVPTLARRARRPRADLIIIDEAHRAPAKTYRSILAAYSDSTVIGLTATPVRSDGRGLDMFEVMISCPSVAEMMRKLDPQTGHPYLVGTRVFAPPGIDLSEVHVRAGEYRPDEAAVACDKPKLVGSIVEHWLRHAKGRQTVVFAAGIDHSRHIVEEFLAAGIAAEHLDGETGKRPGEPATLREDILRRLESGETTIVSNVGVLTEGWDSPPTSCVVLARPTKSTGLFLQMCGRALRPHPGKTDCLIMDHAACHAEHGFVDEEREWDLKGGCRRIARQDEAVLSVTTCRQCFATFRPGPTTCPYCKAAIIVQVRKVEVEEGQLEEILPRFVCDTCRREMPGAKAGDACFTDLDRWGLVPPGACPGSARRAYEAKKLSDDPLLREIQLLAQEKGHKPGWVHFEYQRRRAQHAEL